MGFNSGFKGLNKIYVNGGHLNSKDLKGKIARKYFKIK